MSSALDVVVDTFDFFVDAGRRLVGLPPRPPQLVKLVFEQPPMVRVATWLLMETRRTCRGDLLIEQDGNVLFEGAPPRDGRVVVTAMSRALIRVHLTLESRHAGAAHNGRIVTETFFEPLPNGPPIEVDVASTVLLGSPLACGWHAPLAQRVRLAAIEDGNADERIGPPSGQILMHPSRPGRVVLRFTAETEWGETTIVRTVEVVVPQPKITLLTPATQSGLPGTKARFEIHVENAREVWFVAPARGLTRQVTGDHVLETRFGIEPEEFRITARALHGNGEHSVTLRLLPSPFTGLGAPE